MAIVKSVSKEHAESVNFANIEVRKYDNEDLYMETTHTGLVIELGENNHHDDSDFYAVVWNQEKGEAEKVYYASTRYWTYANKASVDASPEVISRYIDWKASVEAAKEAATIRVGKKVQVVKGRKIPKGTIAEVFWVGSTRYGERIGLVIEGEKVFTAKSNVVVAA